MRRGRRQKPTGPSHDPSRQSDRKRSGQAFENFISSQNKLLSQLGRAYVFKVPTKRRFNGTPLGKVWVDYSGMLKTGRAVALEAKRCMRATSFSFSDITEHQRLVLHRARVMGAVSAVLVGRENPDLEEVTPAGRAALRARYGTRREYYLLPIDEIERIEVYERRKSFPFPKHQADPTLPFDIIHAGDERAVYRLRPDETWLDAWQRIEPIQERI